MAEIRPSCGGKENDNRITATNKKRKLNSVDLNSISRHLPHNINKTISIPKLYPDHSGTVNETDFSQYFGNYHAVLFPKLGSNIKQKKRLKTDSYLSWKDLHNFFQKLDKDKASWTIESSRKIKGRTTTAEEVEETLGALLATKTKCKERGYSSFIVQNDKDALEELKSRLPLSDINTVFMATTGLSVPVTEVTTSRVNNKKKPAVTNINHGPCVWFFFGWNDAGSEYEKPLRGRPEHTDSVSHDGTWHYQLSGQKIWYLRPTMELISLMESKGEINKDELESWKSSASQRPAVSDIESLGKDEFERRGRVKIICQEGDVLLLNTRLWWHETIIPVQPLNHNNQSIPSVSYARDIHLFNTFEELSKECNKDEAMTNVDGLYAADAINSGTILFREESMPDCELHRSRINPNCEIVDVEDENGNISGAIISSRDIKAGEFFCVMESSDSDSSDSDIVDSNSSDIDSSSIDS